MALSASASASSLGLPGALLGIPLIPEPPGILWGCPCSWHSYGDQGRSPAIPQPERGQAHPGPEAMWSPRDPWAPPPSPRPRASGCVLPVPLSHPLSPGKVNTRSSRQQVGGSLASEDDRAPARHAPLLGVTRGMRGAGTWPCRYLLGLRLGPIGPLCLSVSACPLLGAQPDAHHAPQGRGGLPGAESLGVALDCKASTLEPVPDRHGDPREVTDNQ